MSALPQRTLLSMKEAAEWLGLSERQLVNLARDGDIKRVWAGRRKLVVFESLQNFADKLMEVDEEANSAEYAKKPRNRRKTATASR